MQPYSSNSTSHDGTCNNQRSMDADATWVDEERVGNYVTPTPKGLAWKPGCVLID